MQMHFESVKMCVSFPLPLPLPNIQLGTKASLDFGLFTSNPKPLQLIVLSTPVFWVTLLAMPLGFSFNTVCCFLATHTCDMTNDDI